MNNANFVAECRNLVLLSGYAKFAEDGTVLLAQSANDATEIPINMRAGLRLPPRGVACEIRCHVSGYRDEESGHSGIVLNAISVKRASITAVPQQRAMLNALRAPASAAAKPFTSREDIIREISESLQLQAKSVEDLLAGASRHRPKDGFLNRAVLSGFVGHKAYIPPADDGSGDLGSVQFTLMQQPSLTKALMVRVRGADSRFARVLNPKLRPINVIGRVVVRAERDDDGAIVKRHLVIEADRNGISQATMSDFERKAPPAWWGPAYEIARSQYEAAKVAAAVTTLADAPAEPEAAPEPPPSDAATDADGDLGDWK